MPTPKIDYALLGEAINFYESIGYTYVEVPWAVEEYAIRATLPHGFPCMELAQRGDDGMRMDGLGPVYDGENCLIGSAEQGFLQLCLPPDRYVGCTPCFRLEDRHDMFTQDMFMKVELFDNRDDATVEEVITDAERFFDTHTCASVAVALNKPKPVRRVQTEEGIDLSLGGIEIGSYGVRRHDESFGRWVYGTGLALPRFSVAKALMNVL